MGFSTGQAERYLTVGFCNKSIMPHFSFDKKVAWSVSLGIPFAYLQPYNTGHSFNIYSTFLKLLGICEVLRTLC